MTCGGALWDYSVDPLTDELSEAATLMSDQKRGAFRPPVVLKKTWRAHAAGRRQARRATRFLQLKRMRAQGPQPVAVRLFYGRCLSV
jgi:hypothetical protein